METQTEWWTVDGDGKPVTRGETKADALTHHRLRRMKAMQHVREMNHSGLASRIRVLDNPVGVFERTTTTIVHDGPIERV